LGAQRKKLFKAKKIKEGTWTVEKPTDKTPSSQEKAVAVSSDGVKRPHFDSSIPPSIMGLFDGDPTCRFCGSETETVYHIICCCEALARQRCKFFGKLFVEPKDISMALLKDLCPFVRGTGLMNQC
jgi:hypothetical protein